MSTIYVIIGKSLSGKTYTAELVGLSKLVTSTTRPPREGEVDGVDYHFLTDEEYDNLEECGLVVAPRSYSVATGGVWRYFIDRGILENSLRSSSDGVLVLDYKGYLSSREVVDSMNVGSSSVIGIYLDVDLRTRFRRAFESSRRGEDSSEVLRRLYYDEFIDFEVIDSKSEEELLEEGIHRFSDTQQVMFFIQSRSNGS